MKKKKEKKSIKSLDFKKTFSNLKGLPLGKKVYIIIWMITSIFLFILIGFFISYKDKYGGDIKKYDNNYSKLVKVVETVPKGVLDGNKITEDNYFVQAVSGDDSFYDLNNDGKIEKGTDIIPNMFYPISTVKKVPRFNNKLRFDFDKYYVRGYHELQAVVAQNVLVNGSQYNIGDPLDLKEIFDAPEYQATNIPGDAARGLYMSCFKLDFTNEIKMSGIFPEEPFGGEEYQGVRAYDVERQSDGVTPFWRPSDSSAKAENTLNTLGLIFVILFTTSIFTTVGVTAFHKRKVIKNDKKK